MGTPQRTRRTAAADTDTAPVTGDSFVTCRELMRRTTLSRTTVWRLVRDGLMPAPRRLTPTRVAWRESEISRWMAESGR